MSAILNSLNAHNLHIFHPVLVVLVSKFMVHRALSDETYLSLGLLSPLNVIFDHFCGQSLINPFKPNGFPTLINWASPFPF